MLWLLMTSSSFIVKILDWEERALINIVFMKVFASLTDLLLLIFLKEDRFVGLSFKRRLFRFWLFLYG